nr:hypothetical protein [Tanacetum cinerariifolium]
MRTRRSVRTSPLAYDPEVERSARLRRKAVRQFSTNLDFAGLKELFTEMSDDEATGAESPPRGVDSYYRPGNFKDPSPIVYPAMANRAMSNFKIQPNLIAILLVFRVNLKRQMGQLAEEVHKREACKLPTYPTVNPKHKPDGPEHVNMVTPLRNGKTYNNDIKTPSVHDFSHNVEDFVTDDEIVVVGNKVDNVKSDSELRKLKALPKKIDLTEHVSAVLSSSLRLKFKDPRVPLISVVVGNITIKKALLDLGDSINILPASLIDKYDLGTLHARINCRTGAMDIAFGNRKLRLNVFNSLNSPILNDCFHIDTIDECIQTHTPSMNLDRTLKNLYYVDIEKELFDGMTFHEKEEEFQMIEKEFLLSLEGTPLQSQQVQEYVDCLLVHQDVLLWACGSNKGNGCVRKRSRKKMSSTCSLNALAGTRGYSGRPVEEQKDLQVDVGEFVFRELVKPTIVRGFVYLYISTIKDVMYIVSQRRPVPASHVPSSFKRCSLRPVPSLE